DVVRVIEGVGQDEGAAPGVADEKRAPHAEGREGLAQEPGLDLRRRRLSRRPLTVPVAGTVEGEDVVVPGQPREGPGLEIADRSVGAVEEHDGLAGALAEIVESDPLDLDELAAGRVGRLRAPDLLVTVELQGAEGRGEQRQDRDGDRHGAGRPGW